MVVAEHFTRLISAEGFDRSDETSRTDLVASSGRRGQPGQTPVDRGQEQRQGGQLAAAVGGAQGRPGARVQRASEKD